MLRKYHSYEIRLNTTHMDFLEAWFSIFGSGPAPYLFSTQISQAWLRERRVGLPWDCRQRRTFLDTIVLDGWSVDSRPELG